ncbi:MAG TPA: hypothetical protein PL042_01685 [Caldisericia bacterium]|nr:hypothetical protein [Caldisericia bacterium]
MSEIPKLKVKTLNQLINEYEYKESYKGYNAEKLLQNKYIYEVDLKIRINWLLKKHINNKALINDIFEKFKEVI